MIVLKYARKSMYCLSISTTKGVLFPNGQIPKNENIKHKKVVGIRKESRYIKKLLLKSLNNFNFVLLQLLDEYFLYIRDLRPF